jgi:hypothetical protein
MRRVHSRSNLRRTHVSNPICISIFHPDEIRKAEITVVTLAQNADTNNTKYHKRKAPSTGAHQETHVSFDYEIM